MADDVLTRNSADELALRVVQSSGDTGINKDDVFTRDSQGRLSVRTVGGSGGGSGGGASTAADVSFDPSGLNVITGTNVQSALAQVDSSVKGVQDTTTGLQGSVSGLQGSVSELQGSVNILQDSVSVLSTAVELTTEIGGKTTVALSDLTAMAIDGRPSYKKAGATVYGGNGVVGIIDSVDSTNAVITTVSTSVSISKGHTWTRIESSGTNNQTACLIANFGSLSDGWYEVLVKQVREDKDYGSAWRLLFAIENGEIQFSNEKKTKYIPVPELSPLSTYFAWATKDYRSYPIFFAKIGGDFVFSGFSGYLNTTPGCIGQDRNKVIFDVSDVLNLDTGEYMDLKNTRVSESYSWEPEFEGHQNYHGTTPYGVDLNIPNYFTGASGPSATEPIYGVRISQAFEFGRQDSADYLGYGHAPKSILYVYLALSDMSSLTILKIQLFMGEWSVETIKATGIFTNITWDCRVASFSNLHLYPNNIITIPDGLSLPSGYCFCGNGGSYCSLDFITYDDKSEYTPNLQLTAFPRQVPTESSSAYTVYHENGLVEMGGIVPITDTLQPDVALGNVPVVFSQELANANFVPTVTVMTDGTFKRVMVDVANPTTTGFDLCVRNVDTEAVSGIKIAWKVVGTKK